MRSGFLVQGDVRAALEGDRTKPGGVSPRTSVPPRSSLAQPLRGWGKNEGSFHHPGADAARLDSVAPVRGLELAGCCGCGVRGATVVAGSCGCWVCRLWPRRWCGSSAIAGPGPSWFASSGRSRRVMPARPGAGSIGWRCWAWAGSKPSTGAAPARRRRGTSIAALAIWGRIAPGTSRYANATLRRARLAIDRGRFAVAEETLERTRDVFPAGSPAFAMRANLLQQLDLFTGQFDDLRRRVRDEWTSTARTGELLQKHFLLGNTRSFPVDALRMRLEEAGRAAPEDDRVWLGKANLATRTAQFGEADAWLKRCLERRPEDPAVWRARLEWAMASDRLPDAVEAARHLPADGLEPESLLSLRAWLAARVGDPHAERAALQRWLEHVPGEPRAVARADRAGRAVRPGRRGCRPPPPQGRARSDQRRLSYGPDQQRRSHRSLRRAGAARRDARSLVRGARLVDPGPQPIDPCRRGPRRVRPDRPRRAGAEIHRAAALRAPRRAPWPTRWPT